MLERGWVLAKTGVGGGGGGGMSIKLQAKSSPNFCREADLVIITDKQDLQQAMGEVMEAIR